MIKKLGNELFLFLSRGIQAMWFNQLIVICVIGTLLTGTACMAKERNTTTNIPPVTYKLDELSINLTIHAGSKKGSSAQRLNIFGRGHSTLEQNGSLTPLNYSSEDIIKILNSFYQIRFFDLPSRHNIKYSVYLNENGSIGTNALRMIDASSTTVCFNLPDYEKCVTYGLDGPNELQSLTQRLFTEAKQLANAEITKQ